MLMFGKKKALHLASEIRRETENSKKLEKIIKSKINEINSKNIKKKK